MDVNDLVEEAHGAILAWIQEVPPDPQTHRVMDPVAPTDHRGHTPTFSATILAVGGPPGPGQRTAAF